MKFLCRDYYRLAFILAILTVFALNNSENGNAQDKKDEESIEYKLLFLDRKGKVSQNDPDLEQVAFYLTALAKNYQMSREQIADISWAAEKELKKAGVFDEPILLFLKKMHKISKGKDRKMLRGSYATVVAIYLVSREQDN